MTFTPREQERVERLARCYRSVEENRPRGDYTRNIEVCRAEAVGLDFEFVAMGGTRAVHRLGDSGKVAKFAYGPGGDHQNDAEARTWAKLGDEPVGDHLAEVHESAEDGSWLLMESCRTEVSDAEVETVTTALEESEWDCMDISESRPDQIGVCNGTPSLVDYGEGCRHESGEWEKP